MNQINLHSARAAQARLAVLMSGRMARIILVAIAIILYAAGGWLAFYQSVASILSFAFGIWALLPMLWYDRWLHDLPAHKNASSIDDILGWGILGRIQKDASPKQLAELLPHTEGGIFMTLRLGISPNLLLQIGSENPADTARVWEIAASLRDKLHVDYISGAILMAALVTEMPDRDKILAQLQLSLEDVYLGVHWYHHAHDMVAKYAKYKRSGGIGRDLNFGFTPLLERLAVNISNKVAGGTLAREIESHQRIISTIMQQLSGNSRQNVTLVGKNGVGKTTLIYSLAEKLMSNDRQVPRDLRYRQIIMLDPATLLANARARGEIEALLSQVLAEAYQAKNVILFLDKAELFFNEGPGSVDLRNILLPVVEGGALRMILSMDEQEWLKISHASPSLAQQLNRITIEPLGQDDTYLACQDQLLLYEHGHNVIYMYQAIKEAYKLGSRYVQDLAMPGQAIKVLEAAAQSANNGFVNAASVQKAVEQMSGVRIANANQDDERTKLLNLEKLIHERMINQTRAVSVVANALRRARSGVRNPKRPIGGFLFLGPTGVGKTELTKALASVYFGGEDHLVRLDLNEYSQSTDVARLIADASTNAQSLTAQITKQPFSVVLLDEIEKAHPNVLNTLLQLFDEGVLRDANNREVSFRDAIIIATSNAGADKIREYITAGKQLEQFEEEFTNQLIDSGQFKPEFLNRFDEIVLFRPLNDAELLQVVDLILASVNKTLADQHITVQVDDDAKRKMVTMGNDPRLGARPLRRVVQRTVENIVAKRLLQQQVESGQTVKISLADIENIG